MKKFIATFIEKLGFVIISKKKINTYQVATLEKEYPLLREKGKFIKATANGGLKGKLLEEGRTRWLEIGCGGVFEDNFTYVDLFPDTLVNREGKYFRMDIVNATQSELSKLGKFDLIRMQHVFEHFTPEDGLTVLANCAKLLKQDGYILITTPDLKKYIDFYLSGQIRNNFDWSLNRIKKDSPNSFYFSIFTHSVRYEKHEWCYDIEGLIYQLDSTQKYKNIREITLDDSLANIPFTHNRPNEDVCVLAQLL
ncbi:class I SAM-dependent methyltransferase [Spirosoma aerolatum]|uniref:class I SAM-dependent methyltransferase n=1 Tax=Spirosoma aerolatum TaxID=1211326 RepID=UPI0009ACFCEB|nr:methyltransferase domain-containing protein [Spirosoma aerolatum]